MKKAFIVFLIAIHLFTFSFCKPIMAGYDTPTGLDPISQGMLGIGIIVVGLMIWSLFASSENESNQDKQDLEFQRKMNSFMGILTYEEAVKIYGKPTSVVNYIDLFDNVLVADWNYISDGYFKRKPTYYSSDNARKKAYDLHGSNLKKGEILQLGFKTTGNKTLTEWLYSRR